jgi:hypothetical protein
MRWSEIAARQAVLGDIAHDKLIKPGALLVGTVTRDGSARISGAEPLIMDGELWLSMMRTSMKARDLRRDPRIQLHSLINGPEPAPELKVRGAVVEETSRDVQELYATAAAAELGWRPVVGQFTLFRVDVRDVTYIGFDSETGAQHVARWPAGIEYLRPSTTPTSLGPPQPISRLLS